MLGPAHRNGPRILELRSQPLDSEIDPLVATRGVAWVRGEEHIPATIEEAGNEAMAARVLSEQGPDGRERIHRSAAEHTLQESAATEVRAAAMRPGE